MTRSVLPIFAIAVSMASATPLPGLEPEPWPPKAYPLSRYEPAWSRNPFNLKTTPPPVPAATPRAVESFAKHLVIAGMTKVGEQDTLILYDQQNARYYRVTASAGANDLRLVSIRPDRDLRNVVARIAKGNEEAEVRYADKAPANAGQGPSRSGRPGNAGKGESRDFENGRN